VGYEKGHISSIQYTSGTTGAPKPVMIDGNSYNCRVAQYVLSNDEIDLSKGKRLYQGLPISGLAFGEYALQMGMCKGMENVLDPAMNPKKLAKTLEKEKINAFVIPPLGLYEILNSKDSKKLDYSRLYMVAIGGEGITRAKTNQLNKELADNGCPGHILMGGGCSEGVVCNTSETQSFYKPGSAGFPLVGNKIYIADENGNENDDLISAAKTPSRRTVITLLLNNESSYPVSQEEMKRWEELYPAVDIMQELRKMAGWLEANPTRRKTARGIKPFIVGWLSREQDKGRPAGKNEKRSGKTDEREYAPGELDAKIHDPIAEILARQEKEQKAEGS